MRSSPTATTPTAPLLTGLASSARVITAAALIMISVFGAFVLGDDVVIKMFGIGLAVAVFIDATIVRMVIVPAAMTLFDRAGLVAAPLAPSYPRPRRRRRSSPRASRGRHDCDPVDGLQQPA